MSDPAEIHARPWWIAIAAVAGLLLAIVAAGVVGLALNQQVKQVVDRALRYDVELEDEGDDLRVAVLDMRHHHRNLMFAEPSPDAIADFEEAYAALLEEIGELEQLGITEPDVPQPTQIRDMAERYYADFRSAVDLHALDSAAFTRASGIGLSRLEALDDAALVIDRLGERRATTALESVDRATTTNGLALLAVIGGLVLVGATLAYAAVRMLGALRRLYADQQATATALARASQAKTDFIADVSHELRTPLTVLRGYAELGLDLERNCIHRSMLEEIVKESAQMTRMLEDLLFLARSDSASLPLNLEPTAVAPFLGELTTRAEILTRERGAALQAALTGDGQLWIDPARIEQAVLILVDNAAKYSPPGECVTLKSATRSGQLWIEIADRGPGIPEAELSRIFERFYRVDKTRTRKQGGSGLGLSIAKTIVEAHNGRIDVASRLDEGTRMSLCLPLFAGARPAGQLVGATTRGEAG